MSSFAERCHSQTEDRCHCTAYMQGSDHCPECGCEQFERYCHHVSTPYNRQGYDR